MDYIDFGKFLSQQRELRGMSRQDVARATKIPPTLISALEEGQVERMPERIFVMNYIRSYAQVIGLSPEDAMLRFEEVEKPPLLLPAPAEAVHAPRLPPRLVGLGAALLLMVVLVVLWALFR